MNLSPSSNHARSWGEMVYGKGEGNMERKRAYSIIGKGIPRIDAREKATGKATYLHDLTLANMLYGATLKSAHAHARIGGIDTSRAEKLPGVKAVITGRDIDARRSCIVSEAFPGSKDKLPLEMEKVRFIGDEIAAVAAVDLETAERALELIDVTYDVLPIVLDPEQAMNADSPRIHEKDRNVSLEIFYDFGDLKKGFDEADFLFEDRFRVSQPHHCCLEPHGCIAQWEDDGRLTIFSTTQNASSYQWELATVLGMPLRDIRVIKAPHIGGSFGSKLSMPTIVPICACLAKNTGRPVKLAYSRDEEFVSSRTRHPAIIELKTGVRRDGTIRAREAKVILDNGAYNDAGPAVLQDLALLICSYYRVKNVKVRGFLVYTNKPYGGSFRGFANPQAAFAIESQMDIMANRLGIDPVDFRLRNANEPGDITACGWEISSCGLKECIEKAATAIGWQQKRGRADNHGLGIAACIHWGGGIKVGESDFCTTVVQVNSRAQVNVFTGENEIGEGSDTVITQIVAEELGVPMEAVKLVPSDTDLCPSFSFVGSPTTYVAGGAARAAAGDAKRQILEVAARMKAVESRDLDIMDGYIVDTRGGVKVMTLGEATYFSCEIMGMPIIGKGRFKHGPTQLDMETGAGQISPTYVFAAQAVEVSVDPETGEVKVLACVAAHESGVIINPVMADGQVHGGIAQGLGYALTEGLIFDDDGRPLNASFANYKIPRAPDMPEKIRTILVETKDSKGPFGAKALGEVVVVPVAPAVANAIDDAVGVRIKELPITAEKVMRSLC